MTTGTSIPGALAGREALVHVLRRAVTLANGYASPVADDDLRMLKTLGARFVGRAAYVWEVKADDEAHFRQARAWADRVHREVDGDVVLQAAIFEAIDPAVEAIPIPPWVFADLGEAVENRHFSYAAMQGRVLPPAQGGGTPWAKGTVPDLSTAEARRWFYYRARRYLEAGYEALHLGQAHLVAGADTGYARLRELVGRIRAAAVRHARRGWVLLDAHSHGIAHDGRLLFDFTSRPLSARGLVDHPERIALIKRGPSLGGTHPGGWHSAESPNLVEVDNWNGYSMDPASADWQNPHRRAAAGRWGWDDISWLAHQAPATRHAFLRYAHRWTRLQGVDWYFQMPLTRSLGRAGLARADGTTLHRYRANAASPACSEGFGDEEAIAAAWAEADAGIFRDAAPVPASPDRHGLTVPEPVAVVGGLQAFLGGVPGDASCPWSRLHGDGPGTFSRTFAMPMAGRFSFTITCGGTYTDPINQGGVSGGKPYPVEVDAAGDLLRIHFDHNTRQAWVERLG